MMRALIFTFLLSAILFAQGPVSQHREDREQYDRYFEQAGKEFNVPADLLRGISFAESRWTHMQWPDGDVNSSCTGMPRVYGVMGLWDNPYFGFSLRDAARLIGRTPQELKESPLQNIRGAAALLRYYFDLLPKAEGFEDGAIEQWQTALAKFSGFPQEEIAAKRGLEIYSVLAHGYHRDRIEIAQRPVELEKIQRSVERLETAAQAKMRSVRPEGAQSTPDYPLAKWNAAYSGNFGTDAIVQRFVVVHDVEGSYLGCISWFKNASAQVSAHYVLNSNPYGVSGTSPNGTPDAPVGEVTQMVEEKYRAWHVGCWNSFMVGIEHEGYAGVSGWYTPECYNASSQLVTYLCNKYNIPKDRNHVIAHQEHQNATWRSWVTSSGQGFDPTCNTHTDPGVYWDWTGFMKQVTAADTLRPVITAALASSNLSAFPVFKNIVIEFNTPMDLTSTNAAFSITPTVAGSLVWSSDNKTLTFDPTAYLPWNTSFTVKIDSSAKNVSKSRSMGASPYILNFTTVPLDTVGPAVLSIYPTAGESNVSTATDVVIRLNEAVITTSLSATLKMVDENNANIGMGGAKNETINDKGVVSFSPVGLKPNKTYTVKLLAGMKDTYGNITKSDLIVQFTTSPASISTGTVTDDLDANSKGWSQPEASVETGGIDTVQTSWTFVSEKFRFGTGAAKLTYQFTDANGGVADVKVSALPSFDGASTVGMWVWGDGSSSALEVHAAPGDQTVDLGKIFWQGWRFVSFPAASVTGSGKKITSIRLKQEPGYKEVSKIYFDDIQNDAQITGVRPATASVTDYSLEQNYPNPFNPSTEIGFSVPARQHVRLVISDLLGREVAVLVNGEVPAGRSSIRFDAARYASGLYYYSVEAGNFRQTRKMLFVK